MRSRLLKVTGVCAAGAGALTYAAYRKEIEAARQRVETGRQFLDSPDGPIEFAEAGSGPAVLLIHGAGGGFDQGLGLGDAFLGDGYRVIAPSRFGYLGTPLPADASPEAQADAHLRLLDALHLDRVAVIGVSAGGPSAMQLCLRHPERCSALVLVVPMTAAPQNETTTVRIPSGVLPLLNAVLSSDFLFWTAMKVARLALVTSILGTPIQVYRGATSEERRRADELLRMLLPVSRRAAGLLNEANVAANLAPYPLEQMRVPTLVISAADDLYSFYENGLLTAEQIPDGRFVGFSTGGHLLLGHEAAVRTQIRAFLAEHGETRERTAMAV
ncbi:MAG TPA: alpha/beta hydrolase [Thermoanaerobaculia bacterium]|nr:alpha/beta hydrolase [Thermoanaerobaculia bacterium]